jgi:hypothetical protein
MDMATAVAMNMNISVRQITTRCGGISGREKPPAAVNASGTSAIEIVTAAQRRPVLGMNVP